MTDPTATLDAKALCDNVLKNYLVVEKEHINSKVLEALEGEFMILNKRSGTGAEKEYYETEVKPKYEE
jgi:hypothetical protein